MNVARDGSMRLLAAASLAVALAGAGGMACADPVYTVEDLGILAAGESSTALAVNSSGKAVGRSGVSGSLARSVLWEAATPVSLETLVGKLTSTANGINDAGHLTATGLLAATVNGGTAHYWNGTTFTDIGKIGTGTPTTGLASIGNAINNVDQVVGRAWASSTSTGDFRAFSWQGGVIRDLGTLAGCTQSEALDLNDNGQIVGAATSCSSFTDEALVWQSATAAGVSINSIVQGAGQPWPNVRRASGINDSGVVLGQTVVNSRGRCLVFTPGSPPSVVDIGYIGASGWDQTCAPGKINNLGEVVATQTGFEVSIPLLYSGGVLYDLNTVLEPASDSSWELLTAEDINDSGTIVGQGRINGELHAYRATRGGGGSITVADSIDPLDDLSLPFGNVTIGVGATGTVTVTNSTGSAAAISITESLAAPFSIADPGDCTVTLAANDSCTITIEYQPANQVSSTDNFTLDLAGTAALVSVSGTGRLATIEVTDSVPPADDHLVAFGNSVPVSGSGSATVTVKNTDNTLVNVSVTEGLAAPFRFSNAGACDTSLTPGQTCSLTIVFEPTATGSVNDTFAVSNGGTNTILVTVTGDPGTRSADLSLTKTANPPVVQPGQAGSDLTTFTLTVKNNGPDEAEVEVADVLPEGLVYVSDTPAQGTFNSSTGAWSVGSMLSGTESTLQIEARAVEPATGCVINVGTATVVSTAVDPVPGNNSASAVIGAPACADLEIVSSSVSEAQGSTIGAPSLEIVHDITIRNNGPATATGIRIDIDRYALDLSVGDGVPPPATPFQLLITEPLPSGESRLVRLVSYSVENRGRRVYHVEWSASIAGAQSDPDSENNSARGGYTIETSGGGASGGGFNGWCFIATAAYGSYLEPEVQVLRDFRDRFLLTNAPGRAFVGWYYRTSPPFADWIREREWARSIARGVLTPVVYAVKYPGGTGAVVFMLAFALVGWRRRRPGAIAGSGNEPDAVA